MSTLSDFFHGKMNPISKNILEICENGKLEEDIVPILQNINDIFDSLQTELDKLNTAIRNGNLRQLRSDTLESKEEMLRSLIFLYYISSCTRGIGALPRDTPRDTLDLD
jgi:vacuolar-type H+-ATPase subunit E/Vma4